MSKIVVTILSFFLLQSSIYSLHFNKSTGTDISMSSYTGKKILLVNIATGSPRVSQLAGLQQLQQEYADSLIVIAFPSNSFGNEPRTNTGIRQYCDSVCQATFTIAEKANVTGEQQQAIFHWLTTHSDNDVTGGSVTGDFQKYLIDTNGNLIAIFSPVVPPTDSLVIHAITNDN